MTDNSTPASTIKTYMLVGDAWSAIDQKYAEHNNVILLRASDYPSLRDAVEQIKPPANVIAALHGDTVGKFLWTSREITTPLMSYPHILDYLPREGIHSIMLQGCYAGVVENEEILKHVPRGAVLQTMVGPGRESIISIAKKFDESIKLNPNIDDPTLFYVKALSVFDPADYKKRMLEDVNKVEHTHNSTDPLYALPSIIGIGGNPPMRIDLATEFEALTNGHSSSRNTAPIDEAAWNKAIKLVQANFDPAQSQEIETIAHKFRTQISTNTDLLDYYKPDQPKETVQNAEKLRISYALVAAYLDTSGQMARWRQEQINQPDQSPHLPDPPPPEPIKKMLPAVEDVVRNETNEPITIGNQDKVIAKEIRDFAEHFHIPQSSYTLLTDKDIRNIQAALQVKHDGALGINALRAMEDAILKDRLPTPKAPPSTKTPEH